MLTSFFQFLCTPLCVTVFLLTTVITVGGPSFLQFFSDYFEHNILLRDEYSFHSSPLLFPLSIVHLFLH